MKYLPLYYKCMETGELPIDGLCNYLIVEGGDIQLMYPTCEDFDNLRFEGKPTTYWASYEGYEDDRKTRGIRMYGFTPLRQTIVLFLAAMNNEL